MAWYGQNLARAVLYEIQYNEWLYLDLYKRFANVKRMDFPINVLNQKFDRYGQYTTPAHTSKIAIFNLPTYDYFECSKWRTYCIFFLDGKVPAWQGDITYRDGKMWLKLTDYVKGNRLEVMKFKHMNNYLQPLKSMIEEIPQK